MRFTLKRYIRQRAAVRNAVKLDVRLRWWDRYANPAIEKYRLAHGEDKK